MNKTEYIKALRKELNECPEDFQKDIIDTFEEHFTEGVSRGLSEEQVSEELGNVSDVAEDIRGMMGQPAQGSGVPVNTEPAQETCALVKTESAAAVGSDYSDSAPCLVIKGIITSTDVHLAPGSRLDYRMEAEEGFTLGNGLFIRSSLLGKRQKAEVFYEHTDTESRLEVKGAGGKLFVEVPDSVKEIRVSLSSGDIKLQGLSLQRMVGRASSGDIDISDSKIINGKFESVSGDVKIFRVGGDNLELYSVSGDIEGKNISGNVQCKSASGDIEITGHEGGILEASSKSGDLSINSMGNVAAKTISGDVEMQIDEGAAGCQASAVSGDVKCAVTGTDFTAHLKTTSGSIRNKTAVLGMCSEREMHLGQGSTRIEMKSVSGSVTIKNA